MITAAHCVQEKFSDLKKTAEDSTFFIGMHSIQNKEGNFVSSTAEEIFVHPSWKQNEYNYKGDIAAVLLVKYIMFNKFIKPICLWTQTTSYKDIVDKNGVVAGWGISEANTGENETPLYVTIPVVGGEKCLRSNEAFTKITSDNTFCAGIQNSGKGPCNGDSGNIHYCYEIIKLHYYSFQVVH